jgi:glycosyltransferase involved in cell wall biosynthesis
MLKFLLWARNKNTVYDIDDAEYLRFPKEIIDHYIKNCCYIIAGGTVLQDYCLKLNKNLITSTSPVTDHSFIRSERNKKPVIGWVGDYGNGNEIEKEYSHKSSLNTILFPAIAQLKFEVKLILIGVKEKEDIPEIKNYFRSYPNVELEIPENLNWEDDSWLYKRISEFDIGVSPLLDFEFNRAKSAFKAKQYLSCGVPVLASNVGENSVFVNKSNGLICDSVNDYSAGITSLMQLKNEEYQTLSDNALKGKKSYSMSGYCENLIGIYRTMNP